MGAHRGALMHSSFMNPRALTTGSGAVTLIALVAFAVASAPAALAAATPSAPRSVAAVPGNHKVTATWRKPSNTGGAPIDGYRVVWWRAGTSTKHVVKADASARKAVVKSLSNGVRYYFQVSAHNRRGWGTPSGKVGAIPRTTPGAPLDVRATPEQGAMGLTWSAPADNGGAAVGVYAVRQSTDGGQHWASAVTDSGSDQVTTRSTTVHDLHDGTPYAEISPYDVRQYRLEVRAHNGAGWGPWTVARLAPTALVQMPPFVPSNAFGDAAAAAFRDRLTGSYWAGGYPTAAGAGDWHDGGPLVVPIPPSCGGNTTFACPGGVPQDPPPSLVLDLTPQLGDTDRRTVSNVTNGARYDVIYRARVTTSEPVAIKYAGADCTFTVDSTAGTSPDLQFAFQVNFQNFAWATTMSAAGTSVTGLENGDYAFVGGTGCQISPPPASVLVSQFVTIFQDFVNQALTDTCGADEPDWWQPCYPILDNPPPAPPAAAPVSSCPTAPPPAGPYLTLTCNGNTLVRTCASGWADADKLIADGCEHSTAGVVPLQLDDTTAQALADHLSGSFWLGGYPGGVGTGNWYAAPNPIQAAWPACGVSTTFGCPNGIRQPSTPALAFDLSEHGDLAPRRQGTYVNGDSQYTQLTLRGRVNLTAPAAFVYGGVGCELQIDTTQGSRPDIELNVAATGTGSGPLAIDGFYDGSGFYTIQGLEDADILIGPHRWCSYWVQGWNDTVRAWVRDTLVAWAQREGALCGAPDPYYWQRCPT